jgi:excisionase family DNA binding protein
MLRKTKSRPIAKSAVVAARADSPQVNFPSDDRLVDEPSVVAYTSLSRSFVRRLLAAGKFPPPVRIGRSIRFHAGEIREFVEKLRAERDGQADDAQCERAGS